MSENDGKSFNIEVPLKDEAATRRLAAELARVVQPGDVIALWGDLGCGKTAFARAFINALPAPGGETITEDVPSPTFTIIQIYERAPADVWHLDLYRLENPGDVVELGLEDALGEAIFLIEWPSRMSSLLPGERLDLKLSFDERDPVNGRKAELQAYGKWRRRILGMNTLAQ
jgi:tRNA threonylcarbamoyladenosine biosynthesis protein TsaE